MLNVCQCIYIFVFPMNIPMSLNGDLVCGKLSSAARSSSISASARKLPVFTFLQHPHLHLLHLHISAHYCIALILKFLLPFFDK